VFSVVIILVVLIFMVIVVVIIVMIVVIIVIVMVIMVIIVMIVATCGSKSSDISYSNHINVSDLWITIEPTSKQEPSALLDVAAIDNVVVHFTN
jgi:maltose-binding protein MalE